MDNARDTGHSDGYATKYLYLDDLEMEFFQDLVFRLVIALLLLSFDEPNSCTWRSLVLVSLQLPSNLSRAWELGQVKPELKLEVSISTDT